MMSAPRQDFLQLMCWDFFLITESVRNIGFGSTNGIRAATATDHLITMQLFVNGNSITAGWDKEKEEQRQYY